MAAVSQKGDPLPWYTYPCIDFLKYRDYSNKAILEFGAGQSTIWWGHRAASVISLEGDEAWLERLRPKVPPTVELHGVPVHEAAACTEAANAILSSRYNAHFDVVVIDGLWRVRGIQEPRLPARRLLWPRTRRGPPALHLRVLQLHVVCLRTRPPHTGNREAGVSGASARVAGARSVRFPKPETTVAGSRRRAKTIDSDVARVAFRQLDPELAPQAGRRDHGIDQA